MVISHWYTMCYAQLDDQGHLVKHAGWHLPFTCLTFLVQGASLHKMCSDGLRKREMPSRMFNKIALDQ